MGMDIRGLSQQRSQSAGQDQVTQNSHLSLPANGPGYTASNFNKVLLKKKRQTLGGPVTSPTRMILRMKLPSSINTALVGGDDYGQRPGRFTGSPGGEQPTPQDIHRWGMILAFLQLVFKSPKGQSPTLLV